MPEEKGLRYNGGKPRYDLFEPYAMEELAKVFTKGAEKYEENNWLRGMAWSKCLASLKRHIAAFEKGEDNDLESGCRHMAHAAWNALALVSYYRYAPQHDDRFATHRKIPRIGLDIDEVICDWVEPWCKLHRIPIPSSWYFQWDISDLFRGMREDSSLNMFYDSLSPRETAESLPFEPVCYISHRPIQDTITKDWLEKHNFPLKPVFHVQSREDKVKVAIEQKLDFFVDDNYDTFKAMHEAGICCYLMDTKHNARYDVGHFRIKSLQDLKFLL